MSRYTIRDFKYGDTECPMSKLQDLENKIEDGVLVKASDVAREIFAEIEKTIHYVLSIIPLSYKDNLKTVECKKECYQDFLGYIAELKKKYESEGGE